MTTLRSLGMILMALVLSACQRETQVQKANREKILIVGNGSEPKALDLHLVTSVGESKILTSLFEGLVADHPESDTIMSPGAALRWEHNSDFTEWTFHLRQGALWSDGESVTAHDFAFAYQRMLHPDTAAPYVEMLYFLKNGEAFNRGQIKDFSEVGVKVIDDFTLELKLREPVPFLPDLTRHFTWFPVPKHVILSYGKMTDRFTQWCEAGNLVGNGPFVLESWQLNDHILVKKNYNYWNAEQVQLNGIKFLPIENLYTETRAFLAGQLHTCNQLPPDLLTKMERECPQYLRKEPYLGSRYIRLNVTRPALSNAKVRRAIGLSIDSAALCKTVIQGYQPATSLSPNMGDYKPEPVMSFNPVLAKQLLAEAGYPEGKGFPRYSILVSSGTRATSEAIQAMLKQHLGITVDIRSMDFASCIEAQQKLEYDIALAGWVGDYLDPTTFLLMWTKGNGNNNTGWYSEEYENLLREAAHSPDPAQRLLIFTKAEKLLMDEQPIVPFAWQARNYLHHPTVKGWNALLLDNHPWSAVRLEETTEKP